MEVVLPVSLGEALDKLTILDIKLEKIQDARREDCLREQEALLKILLPHKEAQAYQYRILRTINRQLWEIQDEFHGKHTTPERGAEICRQILLENDRRFRVKAKINTASKSVLREQKGQAAKKALVIGHLGLGDMFWMNGAVRQLSTAYDEVVVVCKERNQVNTALMQADDPTIQVRAIPDDGEAVFQNIEDRREEFRAQGQDIQAAGVFTQRKKLQDFPYSFYDDMKLPRSLRQEQFHVPNFLEGIQLFEQVQVQGPQVIVHQNSSGKELPIVSMLRAQGETRLILDLTKPAQGEDHPCQAIAKKVAEQKVPVLALLIQHAEEIHMIESSIQCMATHLDLSAVKRKVCQEPFDNSAFRLGVFETGVLN